MYCSRCWLAYELFNDTVLCTRTRCDNNLELLFRGQFNPIKVVFLRNKTYGKVELNSLYIYLFFK